MTLRTMLLVSFFSAMALVFNLIEGLLPMPLPGIKLGAANVFALLALVLFGVKEAFIVTALRVLLAWLINANLFAFACSALGGFCSIFVMSVLYSRFREHFSLTWLSVAGAWAFNIGQLAAAAFIINDTAVLWYIFPLLTAGTATGWIIGLTAQILCERMKKANILR